MSRIRRSFEKYCYFIQLSKCQKINFDNLCTINNSDLFAIMPSHFERKKKVRSQSKRIDARSFAFEKVM